MTEKPSRAGLPEAIADLLVEVLRVWRTRDGKKLTDREIRERANNGALALFTTFDVRPRDAAPGWRSVALGKTRDPRVSDKSSAYGREVSVALLIDEDGQLWEIIDRDAPVLIGRPPANDAPER